MRFRYALARRRVLIQQCRRSRWSANKVAAAIWADRVESGVRAVETETALKRADKSFARIRCKILIAGLAVWAHLQHATTSMKRWDKSTTAPITRALCEEPRRQCQSSRYFQVLAPSKVRIRTSAISTGSIILALTAMRRIVRYPSRHFHSESNSRNDCSEKTRATRPSSDRPLRRQADR